MHVSRIEFSYRSVVDAQPIDYSGTKLLETAIGSGSQFQEDVSSGVLLLIKRYRFLVSIYLRKRGAPAVDRRGAVSCGVSELRLFDLDDFGAKIGKHHRAARAAQHSR